MHSRKPMSFDQFFQLVQAVSQNLSATQALGYYGGYMTAQDWANVCTKFGAAVVKSNDGLQKIISRQEEQAEWQLEMEG